MIPAPGKLGNVGTRCRFPLSGQLVDIVAYNNRKQGRIIIYNMDSTMSTIAASEAVEITGVPGLLTKYPRP
ncbi:MAG: phytase [Fidelibacterota bacterium]|nr:MAG: phytase [Candidatus Neomarinimicrobiota bacterium]